MMNPDEIVRAHLVALLDSRQAHLSFEDILRGIPFELQGRKPEGVPYSAWQLLEHLRIAQWDILEFSRDSGHVSPRFPEGYWPPSDGPEDESQWEKSLDRLASDLKEMQRLVSDPSTDLYSPIPHGSGQTVLREALLIADHNAYHLGQVLLLRRQLGCPPERSLS